MTEQGVAAPAADAATVDRLLEGDESTFMMLVDQHQPAMLRLAQMYVSSRAVAEEAVQEAWIGILKGPPHVRGSIVAPHVDVQDRDQRGQDTRCA